MISPNIKAVLFDLDGTLRHHLPGGGEVFTNYAISLGLPIGPEDRTRAARWEHYYFANSPEIKADSVLFKDEDKFWVAFGRRRLIALGCSQQQATDDQGCPGPRSHVFLCGSHRLAPFT